MRGFRSRVRLEDAVEILDSLSSTLDSESVGLREAFGRVLSSDVISTVDVPSFDRSAMDGYAVCAEETFGATASNRVDLVVVGQALPGSRWEGAIRRGEAVRIMTGAPIPDGADAVVVAEVAEETDGRVRIQDSVTPGRHIGRKGEDVREGDRVLPTGRALRPQDIAMIASVGRDQIEVVRRPRVEILATGDELLPIGSPPRAGSIWESNSVMLEMLAKRDGGEVSQSRLLPDDADILRDALSTSNADVILISGGSSVGTEDHAPRLVAELGELAVHGIAMRPASPSGFGTVGNRIVFLLPGNPVSCLCAYDLLAGRTIRRLGGRNPRLPYTTATRILARKIVSEPGRVDYVRLKIEGDTAEPIASAGASILSTTTRADAFALVSADSEGHSAGSSIEVYLYDH